ncbi:hypothetical protein [Marinomonas sp.]
MNKRIGLTALAMCLAYGAQANELEGRWVLQNVDNTQAQLDEAVEKVAKEMNFFIRALARPVLKKQTQICQQWQLKFPADDFTWQCDDADPERMPVAAKGEVVKVDEEDVEISGTFQQTSDKIVTVLESERGKRTDTWEKLGTNELLYTAKLESEKLPTPLTWSLTYKKVRP